MPPLEQWKYDSARMQMIRSLKIKCISSTVRINADALCDAKLIQTANKSPWNLIIIWCLPHTSKMVWARESMHIVYPVYDVLYNWNIRKRVHCKMCVQIEAFNRFHPLKPNGRIQLKFALFILRIRRAVKLNSNQFQQVVRNLICRSAQLNQSTQNIRIGFVPQSRFRLNTIILVAEQWESHGK